MIVEMNVYIFIKKSVSICNCNLDYRMFIYLDVCIKPYQ